jgi:predicted nuclease of restriction endonuclease-like (RecB) superfamily
VNSYTKVLEQLKADIQQTQLKATLSVTKEATLLYWRTGKILSEMVLKNEWGSKTLERLSRDLIRSFPDVKGFSLRNLHYMRKFAESYPDVNYAAAAAQIPWGHTMILLDKVIPIGGGYLLGKVTTIACPVPIFLSCSTFASFMSS